jgi:hypothetical protein
MQVILGRTKKLGGQVVLKKVLQEEALDGQECRCGDKAMDWAHVIKILSKCCCAVKDGWLKAQRQT